MVGGKFYDDQAWLNATCNGPTPDAVVGIMELFDASRCGDIALFAQAGYQYGKEDESGHGGLNPDDMLIPFIIAGPGIGQGTIETARTVDLFPTVLDYLGFADRLKTMMPRDGRSLYPEINNLSPAGSTNVKKDN
jgi:arylsulfatase A-like enzyme